MPTTTSFNCTYADGSVLTNQTECPNVNAAGSALTDTSFNVSTDVTGSPFPWWLIGLVVLMVIANQQSKGAT